jgi:16S rRNA (cytosine1402-N4)-methyltransferase
MVQRRLHPPALVGEVLDFLRARDLREGVVCDLTLGTAGHALALLRANPRLRIVGFDRDEESLRVAQDRLAAEGVSDRCRFVHADYRHFGAHLDNSEASCVGGVLLDAGCSLWQLDDADRGMSFRSDGPLDMRFSKSQDRNRTAAQLVNDSSEEALIELLRQYGEESSRARIIVRSLCRSRHRSPIRTSLDLVAAINAATTGPSRRSNETAVTRTFAALRSAVNEELPALEGGLREAARTLAPGGRLIVLTYHSGEDTIAKSVLAELSGPGPGPLSSSPATQPVLRLETKKPVVPTRRETLANPRARTAKLRCAEKLPPAEAPE